ncbi:MAG: DUF1587 domain-containing protein [Gemmatimonadetes bacterium]|nr:DUF1587 domain-containing protein [Gemmatimonadota bacterium]
MSRYLPLKWAFALAIFSIASGLLIPHSAVAQSPEAQLLTETIDQYCSRCHSDRRSEAGLSLEDIDLSQVGEHGSIAESVVSKLRNRTMPPLGRPRPDEATYDALAGWLEFEIDRYAATNPDPGRTETFHRLNRSEYANAVRDLLALEVDVEELLPPDDYDEHGFDNMADILTVSPVLMERYLSAARKPASLAVG